MCATPGNPEELCHQRTSQGKRLEQHDVRSEHLAVTQDVIDHLVDTDLAEHPRKEVVQDALGREAVARIASRPRSESGLRPASANRAPVFATIGAASGPEATSTS